MQNISGMIGVFAEKLTKYIGMPKLSLRLSDFIEIMIISVLFYHVLVWIKTTRTWNLFKGILIILMFVLIAAVFQMNTILWLAQNTFNVGLIALVIIFQPELRHALENIGGKNIFGHIFDFSKMITKNFQIKLSRNLLRQVLLWARLKQVL